MWLVGGILGIIVPQIPRVARPPVMAYILDAPRLDVSELPDDDQECFICDRRYCSRTNPEWDYDTVAVCLPCAHVFCFLCLYRWFSSEIGNYHTCPKCRRSLFEAPEVETLEWLEARIAAVDWMDQSVDFPPRDYRKDIRRWTRRLVQLSLEEAYAEHDAEVRRVRARAREAWSPRANRQLSLLGVRGLYLNAIQEHLEIASLKRQLHTTKKSEKEWAAVKLQEFINIFEADVCSMVEKVNLALIYTTLGLQEECAEVGKE